MRTHIKDMIAGCVALLSGKSDDGLVRVGWTPVQLGICSCRPVQLFPGDADVYGIAAGALNLNQMSAVASLSPLNMVRRNYFAQIGLIDVCEHNCALEVGLLNLTERNFGVSVGVFNVESPDGRLGNDGQFSWLPGLQVGLVNGGCGVQTGFYNIGGSLQIGALNADGSVQIGLLNAAINGDNRSACFQIGLLNYNPCGIVKWMPIFNFSRGNE